MCNLSDLLEERLEERIEARIEARVREEMNAEVKERVEAEVKERVEEVTRGIELETRESALNMLRDGLSYEQISRYINIPIEKIKQWEQTIKISPI